MELDRRFSVPRPSVLMDVDTIMDDLDQNLVDLETCNNVKSITISKTIVEKVQFVRDYILSVLADTTPGRPLLLARFGGDCIRIARIDALLTEVESQQGKHMDEPSNQQVFIGCRKAIKSVEDILKDLGLRLKLEKAKQEARSGNIDTGLRIVSVRKAATKMLQNVKMSKPEDHTEQLNNAVEESNDVAWPPVEREVLPDWCKKPNRRGVMQTVENENWPKMMLRQLVTCTICGFK